MAHHLFICYTPFQLWLAQHIIKQQSIQTYSVVCTSYTTRPADKHRYYFEQLAQNAQSALWISTDETFDYDVVPERLRPLQGQHFSDVYIANPEILITWYILNIIDFEHLHGFDDGARNFLPHAPRKILSHKENKFIQGFQIQYHRLNLHTIIEDHFTIDPKLPNQHKRLIPIELPVLPPHTKEKPQTQAPIYKLWLGSTNEVYPSEALFNEIEYEICKALQISHYLPHPRQTAPKQLPPNIQIISTPMIFEDWLHHHMGEHPNAQYQIYSFFSTTCLSLPRHNQLQTFIIQSPFHNQLYPIFKSKKTRIIKNKHLEKTYWCNFERRPHRLIRVYRNILRAIKKVRGRLNKP